MKTRSNQDISVFLSECSMSPSALSLTIMFTTERDIKLNFTALLIKSLYTLDKCICYTLDTTGL